MNAIAASIAFAGIVIAFAIYSTPPGGRYQIVTGDNWVYKLDVMTGEVWNCGNYIGIGPGTDGIMESCDGPIR